MIRKFNWSLTEKPSMTPNLIINNKGNPFFEMCCLFCSFVARGCNVLPGCFGALFSTFARLTEGGGFKAIWALLAQLCVKRWWYCVLGRYRTAIVGTWWSVWGSLWCYWVIRRHLCLYTLDKVEFWSGVADPWVTHSLTHSLTDFER